MNENKKLSGSTVLVGGILIIAGALVLLGNLNVLSFRFNLGDWWPLILIVLGVVHIVDNRNLFDFSGLFLILLGGVFLAAELDVIRWGDIWRWWPAVLILLGVSILFRGKPAMLPDSARNSAPYGEASLHVNNILAGSDRRVTSQEFKGGDVANILGGVEIDLLEAKLASGDWLLTVSSVLGASTSASRVTGVSSCSRPPCWAASTITRGRIPMPRAASWSSRPRRCSVESRSRTRTRNFVTRDA